MRRLVLLAVLCSATLPTAAKDITVTATPIPLNPENPAQTTVDSLEYVAGFALDSSAPEWGGYSGMVLAADGSSLLAVSDVGHWLKLDLTQDADGRLTGVGAARIEPLLDEVGKPVTDKVWSDAEEIQRTPDGDFLVSFERHHRIWRYVGVKGVPAGPAIAVPTPEAIQSLPENAGVEAMLELSDGPLLLMAEGGADAANRGQAWLGLGDFDFIIWTELAVERSDGFEPTSLAGPSGQQIFLLERRYTEVDGPAARISRLPSTLQGIMAPSDTLAIVRRPLSVDNFEAMATRSAPDGHTFIYLLSDDNQSDKQRTLLLQFRTATD